jgi:hypothetical protein
MRLSILHNRLHASGTPGLPRAESHNVDFCRISNLGKVSPTVIVHPAIISQKQKYKNGCR